MVYSPVFGVNDIYWGDQWLFDAVKKAGRPRRIQEKRLSRHGRGPPLICPWGKVTMRPCDHQVSYTGESGRDGVGERFFPVPVYGETGRYPGGGDDCSTLRNWKSEMQMRELKR